MALFTDGAISSVDDLLAYESSILDVARTEGIDLVRKLELAAEELGIELSAFLVEQSGLQMGLENVVVTEPLHKWHTFQTLALVYRDAYNRQLNDRYQAKWKECERLAKWASGMLFRTGVGIIDDPLPRAERPELGSAPGAIGGATYYVQVTWVNAQNEEGAPSEMAILSTEAGQLLTVKAVNPPANATGWNVYVGPSHADLARQNSTPLGVTETWMEDETGLRAGNTPGLGQTPDYYLQEGAVRRWGSATSEPARLLRG